MIYFLYGPDQYRLHQKVKAIIERYQKIHQGAMNLIELEALDISFVRLMDIARQPSIFIEHRLVVVKNLFGGPLSFQRKLKKALPLLKSSPTIFLFSQEGEEKKNDLFRQLKRYAQSQVFPVLDFSETKIWLQEEAKRYSLTFQSEALTKLASYIQGDLWQGHLALERIASYQKKPGPVSAALINEIIQPGKSTINRFALSQALQNRQIAQALKEVNAAFDRGEAPEVIVGQLNSLLSRLLLVKLFLDKGYNYRQIQNKVPFNPKSVYFLVKAARPFSVSFLKKKLQGLFQIDLGIKTGRFAPREAINDFLLRFFENDLTKAEDVPSSAWPYSSQ